MGKRSNAQLIEQALEVFNKPGVASLQAICDALNNSGAPWAPELRRLLNLWWKSGPNLESMLKSDTELRQKLYEDFRAVWLPTQSGRSYAVVSPHGDPRDVNSDARAFFITITLSPDWEKFGGPCPRCEKYFLRKTAKPSIYCSHRCARQDTAIKRTNIVRQEKHQDKLARAERAKAKWEKLSRKGQTRKDWKEWVAAYEPDITTIFLTRAVNKGELEPPSTVNEKENE